MPVDLSDRLLLLPEQRQSLASEINRMKQDMPIIEGVKESDRTDQAVGENGQREAIERFRKLAELEEVDRTAVTVELGNLLPKVSVGTFVTLKFRDNSQKKSFSITSFDGTLPPCIQGIMRSQTPVASAILGRELGEEVTAVTPSGERTVLIMDIQSLRPVP